MVFDKKEGFRGFFKKYAKSQFLDIEAISGGLWLKWGFGAFYWHRFWRSRSAILFDIVVTFKIKISYCLRSRSSFYQDRHDFLIRLFDFFKFFYPSPRAHFSFDHNQAYFLTFSIRHFQQDQTHNNLSLSIKG